MTQPAEVVVLNPSYWADRAPQLAAIFGQDRVPSPLGDPSGMKPNPEWMVTFVDPGYWASQPRELQDALNEAAGSGVRPSSGLGAGPAAVPTSHVRLTYTVEEAAEVLGISRAFAYEAVKRGELPHIKIRRRILVPITKLEELLGSAAMPDERGPKDRPPKA